MLELPSVAVRGDVSAGVCGGGVCGGGVCGGGVSIGAVQRVEAAGHAGLAPCSDGT